jgi:transcriptional regulator with XRE-family HTH domain
VSKAREAAIFGAVVRRVRKEHEWTQEDLAERSGLTTTYVGQVERGDKVPSLTVVLKLAHALNVLPAQLLESFGHVVLRGLWNASPVIPRPAAPRRGKAR